MKGINKAGLASGNASRFQVDDLHVTRLHMANGVDLVKQVKDLQAENQKYRLEIDTLKKLVTDLQAKYDALETE
jgi:cell division protein FtsB